MYSVGEKFGDYEVLQILGAGGMGQVYKVRNVLSDRNEAMKVLLPNLEKQADLLDRFMREIKVQAGLHHKNIAGLHTAQRQGDRILMFIEYVDGITLDKALSRGPVAPELAANIIGQVLEALSYAHERGIVHRDIKPENIMVRPDGTVKLMDFGIARLAQDRRLTSTGRTVGSLYYMSPEQIRGADDLDGRSDLYSLGITLYQCVTGKRPFDGDSDYSIMSAHMMSNPVPPVQIDATLPQALNDVILQAIAKDRDARLPNAEAFRAALFASVGGHTIQPTSATLPMAASPQPQQVPYRPTSAATTIMPPPPAVQAPLPPPPAMPKGSSNGLWVGLGGLALVAGGWFTLGMLGAVPLPFVTRAEPGVIEAVPVPVPVSAPVSAPVSTPVQTARPPATVPPQEQPQPATTKPPAQVADVPQSPRPVVKPQPQVAATPQPQRQQQQPQQTPVVQHNAYQQPPPSAVPAVDPQAARDLEEARQKFNTLAVRASAAKASVRSVQEAQRASGLGLRRDILEAVSRFDYLMKEASDSLVNRNASAAHGSLQTAERNLQVVEKFLGN